MNKTVTYREFDPPASLRGSIACLWIRHGDGRAVRVLPDACVDVVWRSEQGAVVAGPDTTAWLSPTRPGELIIGARFLPGAGGFALGLPLSEVRNQRVTLAELGLDRALQLHAEASGGEVLRRLVASMTALVSTGSPDRAVQAAVLRLCNTSQRIDVLACELGLSERQLRRRFQAAVGYGPKTVQRVLRLRRFLADAAITNGDTNLAQAAFEAGYADQPHLARECRTLTGLSPGQLVTSA